MPRRSPAVSLLTRQFLQGLLQNDLQSPEADQRETLAAIAAGLASAGLFVSMLMGLKYVSTPFLTPGRAAVATLDDAFLLTGWSFVVMALVAVAKWDVMSVDERDTSILGALPITTSVIVRAKIAALGLFASGFAIALNGAPSLVYPALVVSAVRAPVPDGLRFAAAHVVSTLGAGVCGFAGVLAVRETARALLGAALFRRVSPALHGVLLAALVAAFLLLPGHASGVARTWLAPDNRLVAVVPPLWFVGLHEAVAGEAIVGQPVGDVPAWPLRAERVAMPLYRSRQDALRGMARAAVVALVGAVAVALAAYAWNSRKLPLSGHPRRRRGAAAIAAAVARRTVAIRPGVRAGFFFTLHTLTRSVTHRAAVAIAVAVGAAATLVNTSLPGSAVQPSAIPLSFLATQLAVVTALVVGFRHALRLPADTRVTWMFQLAWPGDDRPYVAGVKRAGLVALVLPAAVALFPLGVAVMGWPAAGWHLLFGALAGCALLDASMMGLRRLPFVASLLPADSLKWAGPVGFIAFLLGATLLASAERLALGSTRGSLILAGALLVAILLFRAVDRYQRRLPVAIDLNELPAPPTQRLGLEP